MHISNKIEYAPSLSSIYKGDCIHYGRPRVFVLILIYATSVQLPRGVGKTVFYRLCVTVFLLFSMPLSPAVPPTKTYLNIVQTGNYAESIYYDSRQIGSFLL